MTKKSMFPGPKMVLVFNQHRLLVSMYTSLNFAAQSMNIPAQSISLCCLGRHISCYGFYFRHYEPQTVEIVPHVDFGKLRLEHFDRMSNLVRRYHAPKDVSRRAEKRKHTKMKPKHE